MTNLLHAKPADDFGVICKAVDISQNPTAVASLETESRVYLALRHLQGRCIPKVHGYFTVWGMLRLLALEDVGKAIPNGPISPSLHWKMKAALSLIHNAGYIHGDIERRNFCIRGGDVFMIDLEFSRQTQDRKRVENERTAVDML